MWAQLIAMRLKPGEDMAEMIRLGAYRSGSDAEVDEAIELFPALDRFLSQAKKESRRKPRADPTECCSISDPFCIGTMSPCFYPDIGSGEQLTAVPIHCSNFQ